MAAEELGLADAIEAVRSELREAQDAGHGSDVRFAVGSVEMEFAVEVTKSGGGKASVTVLGLLALGGKGELSRGEIHRVKVSLTPTGAGDGPLIVNSATARRPDSQLDEREGSP